MKKSAGIVVREITDQGGNRKPKAIHGNDGRVFEIDRVIHCCELTDNECAGTVYIVAVRGRQKYLLHDRSGWYVLKD